MDPVRGGGDEIEIDGVGAGRRWDGFSLSLVMVPLALMGLRSRSSSSPRYDPTSLIPPRFLQLVSSLSSSSSSSSRVVVVVAGCGCGARRGESGSCGGDGDDSAPAAVAAAEEEEDDATGSHGRVAAISLSLSAAGRVPLAACSGSSRSRSVGWERWDDGRGESRPEGRRRSLVWVWLTKAL